jgi:undecaprenyl-diphosphatase
MLQPFGDAILLGTVQGITEFLPISSDGHLALAELLFEMEEGSLTFNVMLHAGTLLATLIVLRERVARAAGAGITAIAAPSRFVTTSGGRDAATVFLASLPTALIGLVLRDSVEVWTRSPMVLGLGFVGTSAWVLSTYWVRPGRKEQPSLLGALLIGVAQGLAVLPGLSRSASTIASALWLGVRPDRAFELSFLMSLPAVSGAILLEARHALSQPASLSPALIGALVALVTGALALLALRHLIMRGRFVLFALWTVPIAIATLAMAAVWPHRT